MKKVLVTGGSGYIGSLTVPHLREKGYTVYNYDKKEIPCDDILNTERLQSRMVGFDVVYHLAAIPHPFKGNECDYRLWNYDVARSVFQTAIRAGVAKFIFASSGCYYGLWGGHAAPKSFPVDENTPSPSIAEGQTLYGYFKAAFEEYLKKEAQRHPIKCVSLRLEGLNKNVVVNGSYMTKVFANSRPEEQSCKLFHFLGNCSPENYLQLLSLVIEIDLESPFEAFNVDNGTVHPSIDPHALIKTYWPYVPDHIATPNGSLISIEKARRLLGYAPSEPEAFKVWRLETKLAQRPPAMDMKLQKEPLEFESILNRVQCFAKENRIEKVSIWGAGKNGRLLISALLLAGIQVDHVVDDVAAGSLAGHFIERFDPGKHKGDFFIALARNNTRLAMIMEQLEKAGCKYWNFG